MWNRACIKWEASRQNAETNAGNTGNERKVVDLEWSEKTGFACHAQTDEGDVTADIPGPRQYGLAHQVFGRKNAASGVSRPQPPGGAA